MRATPLNFGESLRATVESLHDNGFRAILTSNHPRRFLLLFHWAAPRFVIAQTAHDCQGRYWFSAENHPFKTGTSYRSHLQDFPEALENDLQNGWRNISAELTPADLCRLRAIARECYCCRGVDRCDFCTARRAPARYPLDFATETEARWYVTEVMQITTPAGTHRYETPGGLWASLDYCSSPCGLPDAVTVRSNHPQLSRGSEVPI